MPKALLKIVKFPFIAIIKIYRYFISPLIGANCRFLPTCSDYAMQAIEKYGVLKGGFLSIKRILKCNPFCKGGVDELK